jgi:hypothetical protein
MLVGINEAARLTGKSKSVIWNKTKSGVLSAVADGQGKKKYQLAELERVFGQLTVSEPRTEPEEGSKNQSEPQSETAELRLKLALAEQELRHKDEIIRRIEEHKTDIESERDHLRQENATLKMLPAPAPKPNFWQRLTGARA